MNIIWYGTATLEIISGQDRLLIDPYLPPRGASHPGFLPNFVKQNDILLTHGHFDHAATVPKIMTLNENATVYCTKTPARTLEKRGVEPSMITEIAPGDELHFGSIKVTALKGRHSTPDKELLKNTFLSTRVLKYLYNVPSLGLQYFTYPENGETLCYKIEAEGKVILLMGSLSCDPETEYPKRPDLLILPFQGITNPEITTIALIEMIHPKRLLLDHFDNAFPPISQEVSTRTLYHLIKEKYPDLPVVKPTCEKQITLR